MGTEVIDKEKECSTGEAAFTFLLICGLCFGLGFCTAKMDFFEDFYLVDYIPYKEVKLPEVGKCYRKLGYGGVMFKVNLIHNGYAEYEIINENSRFNGTDVIKAREFLHDRLLVVECPKLEVGGK